MAEVTMMGCFVQPDSSKHMSAEQLRMNLIVL